MEVVQGKGVEKVKIDLPLILDDEDYNDILNGYDALPESVKQLVSTIIMNNLNEMVGRAESCQSPIEQLLGIALEKQLDKILPSYTNDFFLNSQEVIEADDKKYRVDFFVAVKRNGRFYGFIIECDGHEFHEKTKEQARKDKKRDRDLLSLGHQVIRFTGSEIVENPFSCAREIVKIILERINK